MDELIEFIAATMFDVEFAVDGVLEGDSLIDVAEGFVDNVVKEEVEECWGKNTPLTDAVVDAERLRNAAVSLYSGSRVAVEFLDEALEFAGEAGFGEDAPKGRAIDGVVGLAEVNEACVGRSVEF